MKPSASNSIPPPYPTACDNCFHRAPLCTIRVKTTDLGPETSLSGCRSHPDSSTSSDSSHALVSPTPITQLCQHTSSSSHTSHTTSILGRSEGVRPRVTSRCSTLCNAGLQYCCHRHTDALHAVPRSRARDSDSCGRGRFRAFSFTAIV